MSDLFIIVSIQVFLSLVFSSTVQSLHLLFNLDIDIQMPETPSGRGLGPKINATKNRLKSSANENNEEGIAAGQPQDKMEVRFKKKTIFIIYNFLFLSRKKSDMSAWTWKIKCSSYRTNKKKVFSFQRK